MSYLDVGVEGGLGTGFCIDPECRFVGTNYHVTLMGAPRKIKGQEVVQQYLATGPDDEGATSNEGPFHAKYTLRRDLAIFELRHPLPKHHGIGFNLDDLQPGQEVDIYAYPKEGINLIRELLQFHGTFKGPTTRGLLLFSYNPSEGKTLRSGASGGIVVDRKTQQIVGILSAIGKSDEPTALAVPVQELVDFVNQVQPYLAERIFPRTRAQTISPVSADLYPKFVLPPADGLQHRSEEPLEVSELRRKAQLLADSMREFIAVQTFAWGTGDKEPAAVAAYEVRILDGYQRFREYPDGKKVFQDVPLPPTDVAFVTGGEWSELPEMVGTRLRLKIHQFPDAVVNGRRMKVFQYQASAEDSLCDWKTSVDYGFFSTSKIFTAASYGEVWTDDGNILRISEHCELPDKARWRNYHAVVTYGWLKRADEPPRLVPVTISAQAELKKKTYWCHGQFTNYNIFGSRVKILANYARRVQ